MWDLSDYRYAIRATADASLVAYTADAVVEPRGIGATHRISTGVTILVESYKDPMTKDGQWRLVRQGEGSMSGSVPLPGGGTGSTTTTTTTTLPSQSQPQGSGGTIGAFIGVASRSPKKSIRVMNNQKTYDHWLFIAGQPRFFGKQPHVGIIGTTAPPSPRPPGPPQAQP